MQGHTCHRRLTLSAWLAFMTLLIWTVWKILAFHFVLWLASLKRKPAGIPNLIIHHSGVRLLPKQNGCPCKSPKVIRIMYTETTGGKTGEERFSRAHFQKLKASTHQKTAGTFDVPLSTARATKDGRLNSAPLRARAGHLGPLSL